MQKALYPTYAYMHTCIHHMHMYTWCACMCLSSSDNFKHACIELHTHVHVVCRMLSSIYMVYMTHVQGSYCMHGTYMYTTVWHMYMYVL
jgi:hypothetical protein